MKKADDNFIGRRGSLPPQLFKYIDMNQIVVRTQEFTDYMNNLAVEFHKRLIASGRANELYLQDSIQIDTPTKLFGQDVRMEYIDGGTVGTVYKMHIGEEVFAFKINRQPDIKHELLSIDIHKKARNLVNRSYIGSTFRFGNNNFSWVLMDYVDGDYANGFLDAKEKLFLAAMSKGLKYSDFYSPGNVKNGKIVDLAGVYVNAINLSRVEIDMVKKFLYFMRTNDITGFTRLAEFVSKYNPDVIKYMFVKMALYQMEIPMRFQPFKKLVGEYNAKIKSHPAMGATHSNSR